MVSKKKESSCTESLLRRMPSSQSSSSPNAAFQKTLFTDRCPHHSMIYDIAGNNSVMFNATCNVTEVNLRYLKSLMDLSSNLIDVNYRETDVESHQSACCKCAFSKQNKTRFEDEVNTFLNYDLLTLDREVKKIISIDHWTNNEGHSRSTELNDSKKENSKAKEGNKEKDKEKDKEKEKDKASKKKSAVDSKDSKALKKNAKESSKGSPALGKVKSIKREPTDVDAFVDMAADDFEF